MLAPDHGEPFGSLAARIRYEKRVGIPAECHQVLNRSSDIARERLDAIIVKHWPPPASGHGGGTQLSGHHRGSCAGTRQSATRLACHSSWGFPHLRWSAWVWGFPH